VYHQSRPWAYERIQKTVEHDLRNHVIRLDQDGPFRVWLCREPGRTSYWFRVIAGHNLIVVTGDIGDLIVTPRRPDALSWMRGALDSPDYFAQKVSQDVRITAFDKELVRLALAQERIDLEDYDLDDLADRLADLENLEGTSFDSEHEFSAAFYESSLYIDEIPTVVGLSDRFYTLFCALKWFDARYEAVKPTSDPGEPRR
jgi:hypothetical protein